MQHNKRKQVIEATLI